MTTELATGGAIAVPLDKISNNPWQARTDEDPAHVRDLALSIAEHGLLQTPVARPHPDQPGHVQLAFGHSRLRAYRLLADDHATGGALAVVAPDGDKRQWQAVHRTDYNCWTCGDFAGQRRLTKRDMESGWTIVEQAGKTINVNCPDCGIRPPGGGGKDIQAVVKPPQRSLSLLRHRSTRAKKAKKR